MYLARGGDPSVGNFVTARARAHEPRRNVQQPLFRCLPNHRANRQVFTVDVWMNTDLVAQKYLFCAAATTRTTQRRLAWTLRKDDTHKPRSVTCAWRGGGRGGHRPSVCKFVTARARTNRGAMCSSPCQVSSKSPCESSSFQR